MGQRVSRLFSDRWHALEPATTETILFADLDNTLIGDEIGQEEFNNFWPAYAKQCNGILVYNTGRGLPKVMEWISQRKLLPCSLIICNQGCNIYEKGQLLPAWAEMLCSTGYTLTLLDYVQDVLRSWSLDAGMSVQIWMERSHFHLRVGVKCNDEPPLFDEARLKYLKVTERLEALNLPGIRVLAWSAEEVREWFSSEDCWRDYGLVFDVTPAFAGNSKGPAANFVQEYVIQRNAEYCRVTSIWAGDGENDVGMLDSSVFHGIVVSNACQELKDSVKRRKVGAAIYVSQRSHAAGVVEGLRWFEHHSSSTSSS